MYILPKKIEEIIYILETIDQTYTEEEKKYMIDALQETYKVWKEENGRDN